MKCAYGSGIKWTFEQLRKYFLDNGYPWDLIWVKIETLIIATCITLCQLVPDLDCCFELLGFDVILDSGLKPWLLEVNGTPAMAMDNEIDYQIKPRLIRDTVNLCNFEPYKEYKQRNEKKPKVTSVS